MNIPYSVRVVLANVIFAVGVMACVMFGQFTQYVASREDMRYETLAQWAQGDEQRLTVVDAFKKQCLVVVPMQEEATESFIRRPLGISECADIYGFSEMMPLLNHADDVMKSAPWPLSMLIGTSEQQAKTPAEHLATDMAIGSR